MSNRKIHEKSWSAEKLLINYSVVVAWFRSLTVMLGGNHDVKKYECEKRASWWIWTESDLRRWISLNKFLLELNSLGPHSRCVLLYFTILDQTHLLIQKNNWGDFVNNVISLLILHQGEGYILVKALHGNVFNRRGLVAELKNLLTS